MIAALWLHTAVHLTCLRRNRLVHAFAVLVAAALALAIVPGLALADTSNRFQSLQALARTLHGMTSLVTSGLGLFLVWMHRRGRSLTMVATTHAPFGAWVASLFVTGAVVAVAAHAVVAILVVALSQAWGVTYQYGFAYLALDQCAEALITLGVVTTLSAVVHPVLTVAVVTLVNDTTVLAVRQGLALLPPGPVVSAAQALAAGLYYLLPTFDPFGDRTAAMLRTMRAATSDWRYLAATAAYAALVLAVAQVTTLLLLRRRPTR